MLNVLIRLDNWLSSASVLMLHFRDWFGSCIMPDFADGTTDCVE